MAKRRIPDAEKYAIIADRMAIERPRNPAHMVIVSVQDESDDHGVPIVTVVRMRSDAKRKKQKTKRK